MQGAESEELGATRQLGAGEERDGTRFPVFLRTIFISFAISLVQCATCRHCADSGQETDCAMI